MQNKYYWRQNGIIFMNILVSNRDINAIKKHWRKPGYGGVFICGYEKFCNLMKDDQNTFEGCDLLVCDEGHTLKNPESTKNRMVNRVRTPNRIILSGTPLQNNLDEYYQTMKIIKSNVWSELFGVGSEQLADNLFNYIFKKPMKVGQLIDSSQEQFISMTYRSYVLNDLLNRYIHRKNGLNLAGMPEKNECVLHVCLTDVQKKLYRHYLGLVEEERNKQNTRPKSTLFRDKNKLTLICNHPKALSDPDNIDATNNELIDASFAEVNNNFGEWWWDCCTNNEFNRLEASNKMALLFSILGECEASNEKALLFSHSLATLDTIEHFLEEKYKFRNQYYFRMDGNTKNEKRNDDIKSFRKNNTSRLYLISTTAGGVGINLISANRVIIFDLSWNPSLEVQSIYRVYRIGQEKACKIYRFVAAGTMEEKIYNRQVEKLDLAERIVDRQQINRHFSKDDLAELYDDNSDVLPGEFREQIEQNPFFVNQLQMNIIQKCESGDRLLNNDLDDILSDRQKEQAYEDYHQTKKMLMKIE